MTGLKGLMLSLGVLVTTGGFTPVQHLCSGFVPENTMYIPVTTAQVGGMTEAEFNSVIDTFISYYEPIVASRGATLQVNRKWSDGTVNASANQSGRVWHVNMYGGLARHRVMDADGFALVICHEGGHHLGGAPKIDGWFSSWATNEGGADYFANLKCLRRMFNDRDNEAYVKTATIDPVLQAQCDANWSSIPERNLCVRSGMAGMTVSLLFQDLSKSAMPKFDTPDPSKVNKTNDAHPATQCRLDTYLQGSLCNRNYMEDVSDTDVNVATCTTGNGDTIGLRPLCWYAP